MDSVIYLFLVTTIALVALIATHTVVHKKQRAALDAAEKAMDPSDVKNRSPVRVKAVSHGRVVSFGLAKELYGRPFTLVSVELPPTDLSLELRRQGFLEKIRIRRGQAVDVNLGDPAFDSEWVVEG